MTLHAAPPPPEEPPEREEPAVRKLILTPASSISPKRVRWIWKDRIAIGTLALLAGREGLGKSTLAYDIAARVTRGTLEGEDHGNPRAVIVCAAEDSWEHTIVPRLIAAGADLERIFRAEIKMWNNLHVTLSLPRDFAAVREAAQVVDAGLMILDPLMSVIDSRLDTHRDREVRTALEPLKTLAEEARMAIVGLIHHNKSGSTDALQLVMGSKAFSAVARSVHTCIPDPDDETQERRLFATSKNNLGRLDLPVLGFTITGHAVETTDDGVAWTGRLHWTGEIAGNMHEIMARTADPERSATTEAADWLRDYLTDHGGECAKVDVEKAGRVAGHSPAALRRARERLRLGHRSSGFPRQTFWSLPGAVDLDEPTDITEPTHPNEPVENPAESRDSDSRVTEGTLLDTTGDTTGANSRPSRVGTVASTPVASVVSTDDTTSTTGSDLRKRSHAHARAHAGGDNTTSTTEEHTRLSKHPESPVVPVVPVASGTPRARPRETPASWIDQLAERPPPCPDCGHPLDSTEHETTCEAP